MTSAERRWQGLLFVAPFLLLYLLILIYPLLRGLWLSLYQVDLFGGGTFVGLANYARLAAIKAKVDPANLFRMNQNIQPAGV